MKTLRVILLSVLVYLFVATALALALRSCAERSTRLIGMAPAPTLEAVTTPTPRSAPDRARLAAG